MKISAKFKGADFKYDNSFFSSCTLKHPNETILVPVLKFFCFFLHETLQFLKFVCANFKHGNSLFEEVLA